MCRSEELSSDTAKLIWSSIKHLHSSQPGIIASMVEHVEQPRRRELIFTLKSHLNGLLLHFWSLKSVIMAQCIKMSSINWLNFFLWDWAFSVHSAKRLMHYSFIICLWITSFSSFKSILLVTFFGRLHYLLRHPNHILHSAGIIISRSLSTGMICSLPCCRLPVGTRNTG